MDRRAPRARAWSDSSVGAALIPVTGYVIAPLWKAVKGLIRPRDATA